MKYILRIFPVLMVLPAAAEASFLHGESLDKAANILSWVVMIVAPLIFIGIFWMVHVLPEKVAEKKGHPQVKAIQVLCLLSLVFGGLLWPLAWLWAYTKPVFYKMAYGTDTVHPEDEKSEDLEGEIDRLKDRLGELQKQLKDTNNPEEAEA